jgi:hypothetical protein
MRREIMNSSSDEDSSWSIGGEAAVLSDAAVSLRAAAAQPDDHVPVSREFVFNAVAKLLEAMGEAIGHGTPLPHDLVEAGSEIARHVRRYRPRGDG